MNKKFFMFLMIFSSVLPHNTDLIIFSYNRPMQLYALLESIEKYVSGLEEIFVIYRASEQQYADAYQLVKQRFPVHFYHQDNPPSDFKAFTLHCFTSTNQEYILFAVDDDLAKDFINVQECIELMQHYDAYGFYLRLGKNLNYCYAMFMDQSLPQFIKDEQGICLWRFSDGPADWNYPHTLDMTLYRKKDLEKLLHELEYSGPNQLEHYLAIKGDSHKLGLCYEISKIMNLPINVVQNYTHNNCTNSYSPQDLQTMFEKGLRIDIDPLYQYKNFSCHVSEYELTFKQLELTD